MHDIEHSASGRHLYIERTYPGKSVFIERWRNIGGCGVLRVVTLFALGRLPALGYRGCRWAVASFAPRTITFHIHVVMRLGFRFKGQILEDHVGKRSSSKDNFNDDHLGEAKTQFTTTEDIRRLGRNIAWQAMKSCMPSLPRHSPRARIKNA